MKFPRETSWVDWREISGIAAERVGEGIGWIGAQPKYTSRKGLRDDEWGRERRDRKG